MALDDEGALTLNSANIMVPDTELHPYFLLAVLNALCNVLPTEEIQLTEGAQAPPVAANTGAHSSIDGPVIAATEAILAGDDAEPHRALIDEILEEALGVSLGLAHALADDRRHSRQTT